ncbi:DUF7144 family membrane protein [Streptomyces palmae]|uniref:DUF7144 domain-containing protein n=1 Tax=Streptomyces palmae TaxID=1701085 RepID=A0A4Z0HGM1_9ACTN|nr:hypothetical protein [Streptomyces palmae]TGB19576.1 hypothetical protein E4099_00005 [Streptomyces palmae]
MSSTTRHGESAPAVAYGLLVFAAVMLIVGGILDILRGIMGIHQDAVFVSTPDYLFKFDTTGWGWIHLIAGAVAILVGVGLFKVSLWARVLGVIVAAVLILINFLSIPYFPLWSIVAIAFYGFVIWAICVVRAPR